MGEAVAGWWAADSLCRRWHRTLDGSVDLYFGPRPPKDFESNWTQTVSGKGWFSILRLYGPLEPWFEKTWRPGEITLIEDNR